MSPQEEARQAVLSIFVPAAQAAICAESTCGGVFLAVNGQCPGCGSKQWVLMEPNHWTQDRKEERS